VTVPERFGSYFVYELLGTGGMATVHRAESLSAGGFRKRVALKRLLPHLADDPQIVEAFTREAKLASHLRHANIAQTYDLGRVDDTYFIAMELVAGPTLRQIVRQCESAAGPIPIEHALDVLVQICEALDYAHQLPDESGKPLGIVHRDVSPANIIVAASGTVKLIDFGLAKVKAGDGTKAGVLKGKLGYMAPEYTLGRLDARADLFAVGVIAHELLTGRRLFDHANDFEIIRMLREMPVSRPSRWNRNVGADLDDIVMTALQREPYRRWQSATALHAALLNFARGQGWALTHASLGTWVEWAFTQQPRREHSVLARVIDTLGDASETSAERAPTNLPELSSGSSVVEVSTELSGSSLVEVSSELSAPAVAVAPEVTPPIPPAAARTAKPPSIPPAAARTAKPPSIPPALDQLALVTPAPPSLDQLALATAPSPHPIASPWPVPGAPAPHAVPLPSTPTAAPPPAPAEPFADTGTDIATRLKIPAAPHRRRAWPLALVLVLVALLGGAAAAVWYLDLLGLR
jgi:eukaryotic-like serine/threonine-protein kinase